MTRKLGREAKAYYSSALLDGSTVTPANATWQEVLDAESVELTDTPDEIEKSGRADNIKVYGSGQIEYQPTMILRVDPDDTIYQAILAAASTPNTEIAMAFMTGDITTAGEEGPVANWVVVGFDRSEQRADALNRTVVLRPSSQAEEYVVA